MKAKIKYVFIHNSGWYFMKAFEDLRGLPDVKLKALSSLDNWRLSFYQMIHRKLPSPNFFLWQFNFSKEKYVFVLEHQVLLLWGYEWIVQLRQKYRDSAFFVLTLFDSMKASSPGLMAAKESIMSVKWDLVYTFDKEDAEFYGWKWLGFSYFSSYFKRIEKCVTESDAYFIGGLKGDRTKLILDVALEMERRGLNFLFELLPRDRSTDNIVRDKPCHIIFLKRVIKYGKVQKNAARTNCIVEILQKNQHCQSYRYFEAIYYNKKLLTNNPNVIHYPFYDPRYIKIFRDAGDIDFEWVRKREKIDYGYNNEFSPIHLLNMIKTDIQRTGQIPQNQFK